MRTALKYLLSIFNFIKKIFDNAHKYNYRNQALAGRYQDQINYINMCLEEKDYLEAYCFADIACYRGIQYAFEAREKIKEKLSQYQLEKAISTAQELKKKYRIKEVITT